MPQIIRSIAFVCAAIGVGPAFAAGSACFFENANYTGASFCTDTSNPWVGNAWNDRVSSVQLPPGTQVTLFENSQYGGRTVTIKASTPNLTSVGFDNALSSLQLSALQGNGSKPAGVIDRFEVVSTVDAYNGATPAGAAGPYVLISGIVHGRLDPAHANNAGIVDLNNAPRDAGGFVAYTTDVAILRPKRAADARRVLFYDVVNRGGKAGQGTFIGGGALDNGSAPDANFPSILRRGYTVVWSGWQGGISQSGQGGTGGLGTSFPFATNSDGSTITGIVREEYVPDTAGGTIGLTYAPASLTDLSEVTFTARQSWLNARGQQDYASSPSVPVTNWSYVSTGNGNYAVKFTPPSIVPGVGGGRVTPDSGTIYTFVYRGSKPRVNGIGFAAVRDLVDFLKTANADAQGFANPLNDLKGAACASGVNCAANPSTNFDVALADGISQSGRFVRDFLYQGFNNANGTKVFDGLMPIIAAGRRTWTNGRFSQMGRWSKQHEDHWMPGDQFPFSYSVITDPLTGNTDGLLKKCLASNTCPKIMQLDGSFEWWGGRASLNVTDGAGRDIALPDNVRYYLVSGTQHGGGDGVRTGVAVVPAAGSKCQFPDSRVTETPVERALLQSLENWVIFNTPPPASQYPTVAAGTLVSTHGAIFNFPKLANINVPSDNAANLVMLSAIYIDIHNQLYVTDYSSGVPSADLNRQYQILVPQVGVNGNEIAGIQMPEMRTPVATFAGWNMRGRGHAEGEACDGGGMMIPFAVSTATKSPADTRPSLDVLYRGRADYIDRFSRAADDLVRQGFLTQIDADNLYKAGAKRISTNLILNP